MNSGSVFDILCLAIFCLMVAVCVAFSIVQWRLFHRFCRKYPREADNYLRRNVPELGRMVSQILRKRRLWDALRNPENWRMRRRFYEMNWSLENWLFFLRPSSAYLFKGDRELWRMRQAYVWLAVLSLSIPALLFSSLLVLTLLGHFLFHDS